MLDPGGRGMQEKKKKTNKNQERELIDDINILFFLASQEKLWLKGITLLFKEALD